MSKFGAQQGLTLRREMVGAGRVHRRNRQEAEEEGQRLSNRAWPSQVRDQSPAAGSCGAQRIAPRCSWIRRECRRSCKTAPSVAAHHLVTVRLHCPRQLTKRIAVPFLYELPNRSKLPKILKPVGSTMLAARGVTITLPLTCTSCLFSCAWIASGYSLAFN